MNYLEMRRDMKLGLVQPTKKAPYVIPKVSEKKSKQMAEERKAKANGTDALSNWFNERHKKMSGTCKHCGGKTQKEADNFKCSIAHILPKAYFPSVAAHPDNWIELCFYGNSCHTNFDNNILDITELNCFDEVIEKFNRIYPSIAKQERKRIPEALLQYLEL
jgi:hypothetical protein